MANEIKLYESAGALAVTQEMDYVITAPNGAKTELLRNSDFGVIPGTHRPSLYKSGAMKIKTLYGFFERHTIVSMHTPAPGDESPYYEFIDKCDLIKINPTNGQEYIFQTSYAGATQREKRNGRSSAFDQMENALLMAQKRSLVAAVVAVSNLSSMFTLDIEDQTITDNLDEIRKTIKEDSKLTKPQVNRLYAIANSNGGSTKEIKEQFTKMGYASTYDILQRDYNDACELAARKITGDEFLNRRAEREVPKDNEQ